MISPFQRFIPSYQIATNKRVVGRLRHKRTREDEWSLRIKLRPQERSSAGRHAGERVLHYVTVCRAGISRPGWAAHPLQI
jgi:hypothetical protein